MNRPQVLIIDDEENLIASLSYGLRVHGIDAFGATSAAQGLAALEERLPDMAFVDLRLPDATGIELLSTVKARHPRLPVAMISAHGDIRVAVEAVKVGALDFIAKPFELEDIVALIRKTVEREAGTAPPRPRKRPAAEDEAPEPIGESPAMLQLKDEVEVVAKSSARIVLLLGPSGSGKGLIARILHQTSIRQNGPFVVVNCASLPEHLLEAELFGAERGAYTGAHQKRVGLVELAEGGTLFLDEVGELPLALQSKLLRFLENRAFRPVGGGAERMADVRVVAATNRDIEDEVKAGHFRADLFYRLNVVPLHIPPLSERKSDVMVLARHFAAQQARQEGCIPITFSAAAETAMTAHRWPGNIRELRNLVERLTILHPGQSIEPCHLPGDFVPGALGDAPATGGSGIAEQMVATEKDILLRALRQADGSKGRAADILGISRYALKRRLNRLNLD